MPLIKWNESIFGFFMTPLKNLTRVEHFANLVRQQLEMVAVLMVVEVVVVALLPAGATCAHDLIAQRGIR